LYYLSLAFNLSLGGLAAAAVEYKSKWCTGTRWPFGKAQGMSVLKQWSAGIQFSGEV
jgi:hypothetical protein